MTNRQVGHKKAVWMLSKKRLLRPPPKNGIMFIGSSIFRLWTTLEADLNPLPVYNQAFGGSRTWEVLHYADKLVLPHQPNIIVYYCGSNDISAGESANTIARNFQMFAEYTAVHLPKTPIFFVSINRAPEKQAKWSAVDRANMAIAQYCHDTLNLGFIDVNPCLFADNRPCYDLYLDDLVHLQPLAYQEFTKIIKPILEQAYEQTLKSDRELI